MHALDAHAAHPKPFTADDLLPFLGDWRAKVPTARRQAMKSNGEGARSRTKQPKIPLWPTSSGVTVKPPIVALSRAVEKKAPWDPPGASVFGAARGGKSFRGRDMMT